MKYVDEWFSILLPQFQQLLYANGGNIIMVQLENEYGSYAEQKRHTDTEYLIQMRNLLRKYLGTEILVYATDGCSSQDVLNSNTPGVFRLLEFDGLSLTCFFKDLNFTAYSIFNINNQVVIFEKSYDLLHQIVPTNQEQF